ncbi:MAG TPA: alkaline phosphatase family protein [Kofleriaceae bacterium]|nr:alkaline phosphatase family protein [Kofleriaceae bacterium]
MRLRLASALLALAACAGSGGPPRATDAPRPGTEPKLVVLLVIDQWPEWAFEAKRPALHAGFDRLLREGEWHIGEHPTAATLTAVGHALIGTGVPPAQSGVLSNEWWRRDVDRLLKSVEAEDGTPTAKWLRAPGLGDALAAAHTGGRAFSVSLKDRAAILPLGHAGTPIWFDTKTDSWVTLAERGPPPAWLAAWNTEHPVAAHYHDTWTPLPETPQLAGIADDAPAEAGARGFGPTFPHALDTVKKPAEAISDMPLGNDLVLDTATAVLEHEHLGGNARPDLLVVSLSAHDYIGHAWGQESWESWDAVLRLDRRLDQFLADLDAKVGAGRWSMLVTSDHGAAPLARIAHGGRMTYTQIKDAANRAAATELGNGDWIAFSGFPTIFLSKAALAHPKDLPAVMRKIVLALRAFPGLGRVEKTADFAGQCDKRTGDALAICLALDPVNSGEILYIPAAGWIMQDEDEPAATNHDSLELYDRLVPVLLLPPGRTPRATAATHAEGDRLPMTSISTIVARWLGVPPPTTLAPPAAAK